MNNVPPTNPAKALFARIGVVMMAAVLTACAPYVDSRREAGKRISIGPSNLDMVAICFHGDKPTPAVNKLAAAECAKTGRIPQYQSRTHYTCSIATSTRVFYR